ncbi:alpha-L-arabinofuranosidase [Paenibacillus sp. FSL A5-0031]|uniref:alpha-L-arabinofuranosidase C-terminal domain-containing protein n=1 Tax=Paenibacillus sp. FSL A5-0031 TaxID=1920420 RepID=UPI00096CE93B|nr:alpha-L-arabinofuranosidase C-terminal domain-containing protein [Paenibacillus sp. FSL A5-0031]OME86166.1 alpha-L-arabinofuranosidase [Paenibacillus sp. FSL A5-0031]
MKRNDGNEFINDNLIAQYKFDLAEHIGKDSSGNRNDGSASGASIQTVGGKTAVMLSGGRKGTSYVKLPVNLLKDVSDLTGITISTWVYAGKGSSVWERIFDFGKGQTGPYMFLTRNLRAACFAGEDLIADPGKTFAAGEWMHISMSVAGTKSGTSSSAGPIVYVNGEVVADGTISQTSSGTYAKLRAWFASFADQENYCNNYIGMSQYDADVDFCGSLSDFRVYKAGLTQDEVIEVMCESLTDEEIVELAKDKYLTFPTFIITKDIALPSSLMGGKVSVSWASSDIGTISNEGIVNKEIQSAKGVTMTAIVSKGASSAVKSFTVSVLPQGVPPYTLTIDGSKEILDVSPVLYGLFYEDINNAADGGIYAELVQNRSFESFAFDSYSHVCGEHGASTGRNYTPLHAWSGDTKQMTVKNTGGLNDFFGITDKDVNAHYVTVASGATITNRGFADSNQNCAMAIRQAAKYNFTIWAKAEAAGTITLQLLDQDGASISDTVVVQIEGGGIWKKYGVDAPLALTGLTTVLGQLALTFNGEISIEMVSLMPEDVWGAGEEQRSSTAHANFKGNPNYRLRKDLVNALVDLHPTFLRFPGGCISEGSHIWENVYDWKESVGDVELRKENFNVWGYMMTMGLGYMEYFQLAEDLNATPLPVMACGVLCQARSDYANPAGGKLRDYYVKNFTDLIDFAISTDFENNEWAALRKKMGHEAAFDLRYLGVGNENWGTQFFANFEYFKAAIDDYMEQHYAGYELHIISTVGAQADDDAYQQGWKFLSGSLAGSETISFTDGLLRIEETVTWYEKQKNYMDTIADEHYYRSNEYLLANADRYNYYYRAYNDDGSLNEAETSKVFVGEYASTDKNTLAGAIAEAAIMTSFENNSDVVRLAATAPLFNKVLTDNTYRWTPDCIWFDDETVWYTPNYYVQQLFGKYIGTKVAGTSFTTYRNGERSALIPRGGIEVAAGNADIVVKRVKVTSNVDGSVLFEQDFTKELNAAWQVIPGSAGYTLDSAKGLVLKAQSSGLNGLYILNEAWTNYKVEVAAERISGTDGFYVGAGLTDISPDNKDVIEYAIGYNGSATGVKVYKQGIEGYTLGDYSSSTAAGNLRASCYEELADHTEYTITVNYGGADGQHLICSYTDGAAASKVLDYKLEAYNREIYHSVTKDDKKMYVKLVNADGVEKAVKLDFKGINAATTGKWVLLTGDASLVHVPNVNKKNDEKITPMEAEIHIENNAAIINLAAHSVNVIIVSLI